MSKIVEVYNVTKQPLGKTRVARAVEFILENRAEAIQVDPFRQIRSANSDISMPMPLKILMKVYVNVWIEYDIPTWSKIGVLERDEYTCGYCGKYGDTVDHINPQSKGGPNSWMNTITACHKCNNKKDNKTLKEAGMKLLFQPKEPRKGYIRSKRSKR